MAIIMGLYLLVDVLQHKGQSRVLFPKSFPAHPVNAGLPQSKSTLINPQQAWKKGVHTINMLQNVPAAGGFECDVYFDTAKNIFDVHHDAGKSIGLHLDQLLEQYRQKKMNGSIWLDIKNLTDANAKAALLSLVRLRDQYGLQNKLLAESGRADLLTAFSDSGFYTSYYIPLFNPYRLPDAELTGWADSISAVLKKSRVNALSGYYFQYTFLQQYFPGYPLLTWTANDRFSLVNWLFKRKISRTGDMYIVLYP